MTLDIETKIVWAISIPITVYMLWLISANIRRLKKRLAEFREEVKQRGGAPMDPYSALAELYAEDERKTREAKAKRRRKV